MTFKPAIWYPIAVVLTILNVVAVGFAAAPAEPVHATTHAALAVGFGLWAASLRRRLKAGRGGGGEGELQTQLGSEIQGRLEEFEGELTRLRQEVSETQERLDFAERLLARGPESRRVEPQR
jgi:hypothetical protein